MFTNIIILLSSVRCHTGITLSETKLFKTFYIACTLLWYLVWTHDLRTRSQSVVFVDNSAGHVKTTLEQPSWSFQKSYATPKDSCFILLLFYWSYYRRTSDFSFLPPLPRDMRTLLFRSVKALFLKNRKRPSA